MRTSYLIFWGDYVYTCMYIPGLERVRIRYLWSRFSHKIDPYSHNRETLFTQKRPILTFVRISYLIFEEIMCTHVRTRSDTCEDSIFMKHRFTQKWPCLHKRDLVYPKEALFTQKRPVSTFVRISYLWSAKPGASDEREIFNIWVYIPVRSFPT